jgi:hypothetical protein
MNSTNTQAQTEQETPKLNPDYSHRLSATVNSNRGGLTDSIGLMTDRALGILYLLSSQFEGGNQFSDALICGAIDAAIQEVEDIKATIIAYHQTEHAKQQA